MVQIPCPSCGALVAFRSEMTLYAACAACSTLLVRKDVKLEAIGKVAELKPDGTLLRVGTQGTYSGKTFEIYGRIQVVLGKGEEKDGYWNEWYVGFSDGRGGWIGESMGNYFVSFLSPDRLELPPYEQLTLGDLLQLDRMQLVVGERTIARVVSFEGELPDISPQAYDLHFVDLKSATGVAGTLDYSDDKPKLFLGKWCSWDDLKFHNLRQDDPEAGQRLSESQTKTLKCPSCGAPHTIKAGAISQTLVCQYCDHSMNLNDDGTFSKIVKLDQERAKVPATIPLGTKGTLPTDPPVEWECIGYLRRSTVVDGVTYSWSEYLLYEQKHGYRWLTDSDSKWTFLSPLFKVPTDSLGAPVGLPPRASVTLDNNRYEHFQTCEGSVDYVAGEFYWRVKLGDKAMVYDYVHPPYQLSAETSATDVIWTSGAHLPAQVVWDAFKLKGSAPTTSGIASSEANPYNEQRDSWWKSYSIYALLGFLMMMFLSLNSSTPFFNQDLHYDQSDAEVSKIVPITVPGRVNNLEIELISNLNNRWVYFQVTLINEQTHEALDSGCTVSLYTFHDEDGWSTEGSNHASLMFPKVQGGNYLLRVEPQSGTNEMPEPTGLKVDKAKATRLDYTVKAYQGVPLWWVYFLSLGLLIIPPLWVSYLSSQFETQRWSQSDHPTD